MGRVLRELAAVWMPNSRWADEREQRLVDADDRRWAAECFRYERTQYRNRLARGWLVVLVEDEEHYLCSLRGASLSAVVPRNPRNVRRDRDDYATFPSPVHVEGCTHYFLPDELRDFYRRHPGLRDRPPDPVPVAERITARLDADP